MKHTDDEILKRIGADLEPRRRGERARYRARSPRPIGPVLTEILHRHGYAGVQASEDLGQAWEQAVREATGNLAAARLSRTGKLRRGVLEVWVANSIMNQEITFHCSTILARLLQLAPQCGIRKFQIRVGSF